MPVLAYASAEPHPDQALLDAEAAWGRADEALDAANEALLAAWDRALEAAPCPHALRVNELDRVLYRTHRLPCSEWQWAIFEDGSGSAWTGKALRSSIKQAVGSLGPSEQTFDHIRRWRGLLPAADAFDAHLDEVAARCGVDDAEQAMEAAEAARARAEASIVMLPATTVEGLAVKMRLIAWDDLHLLPACLFSALQTAANISGVELYDGDPGFDAEAWVCEVEAVGGTVQMRQDEEGFDLSWTQPKPRRSLGEEERAAMAELRCRGRLNRHKVREYLWRREFSCRPAGVTAV